jgi:O-antigen/teichoic acid export membrane protein
MSEVGFISGSPKKIVAFNTGSQLVGKVITGGSTFIISLILARTLGVSGYGDFTKITTYVTVFYLLSDFGLNAIFLQRDNNESKSNLLWSSLISLRLILGFLATISAIIILYFLPGDLLTGYSPVVKIGVLLFLPTIFFQTLINSANAIFQKKLRYDLATIAIAAGSLMSLIMVIILPYLQFLNHLVLSGIIALLAGSLITTLLAIWLALRFTSWRLVFDWFELKRLFTLALPLGLTLICNVIYFRADSFILALTRSTSEVGIYGFAYKLFEFPLVLPTFFMNSVYPLMLNAINSTPSDKASNSLNLLIRKSGLILFMTSLLTMIMFWFIAPWVTIIRPEFSGSIGVIRILSAGLPLFFLSSLTMWILIVNKKQNTLFAIYAISMVINIVFNWMLIPNYGYFAAAWVTIGSEGIVLLLSLVVILRTGRVHKTLVE